MKFTNFDEEVITFGKHKGEKFSDIPSTYLVWLARNLEVDHFFLAGVNKELEKRGIDPCEWGDDSSDNDWWL